MTARTTVLLFGVTLFASLLAALPAYAQLNSSFQVPGIGNALSIELNPLYPGPDSSVQATAESPYLDLSQSTLTWYVNGVQTAQGTGVTHVNVESGGLGQETDVEVTAESPEGSASAQAAIIPNEVGILWESNSYTPPFYRGRALPSAGSAVRLEAMARFKRADGSEIPADQINYTWKQDGAIIQSASGLGDSSLVADASPLYANTVISVTAASQDGTQSGAASVTIATVQPQLTLYEDHPVFGILYGNALTEQTTIPESEMTFAAVPYFAAVPNPNDPLFQYAWQVNNQTVAADPKDPSEITVNAQNSNGAANISLDLTNAKNIFIDISDAWNILLSGGTSGPNPFTGTQ